jgi:hypothetical protein
MSDEKSLSLNNGEDKTPSGGAQPVNNTQVSDEEIDKEIDSILANSENDDDDDDDDDDDTIVLPKKQVEKLKENLKNYKEGLLSVKDKLKHSAKSKTASDNDSKKPDKKVVDDDDAPITKGEIRMENEKKAIAKACEDEDIEKNWTEIVKNYSPRHGKDSVNDIVKDIKAAKYLWEREKEDNGDDDEEDGDDKKSTAEIAAEKAKTAGTGSKGKTKESKHVLPTKTPIKDWYPKKDAK